MSLVSAPYNNRSMRLLSKELALLTFISSSTSNFSCPLNQDNQKKNRIIVLILLCFNGAPDTTRTCDSKLRRIVLYPAELRARHVTIVAHCFSIVNLFLRLFHEDIINIFDRWNRIADMTHIIICRF